MIPENKQASVKKALQTAFGVDTYDTMEVITTGLSNALTFRIVIKNKPYLMKIARTDQLSDPAVYYNYMKVASDAEIAPKVWYLSTEDKISITDFIEAKPFTIEKAMEVMPKLLSKLHNLHPFHKVTNNALDKIIERVLEDKFLPENLTEHILKNYTKIKSVYSSQPEDFVSCHNDLKPENYIFDGKNAWLVDWEAAFLNDRYLDLGVVANFVVNNEDDEFQYLKSYFGEAPDQYKQARFFLMRQLLHIQYMSIFILYASKSVPIMIDNQETNFRNFHKCMWEGEIDLSKDENKLQYALVHMNQLLTNINSKRFEDSLKIISSR